ncbi:response regulator [Arenibacter sp. 6A1]|uniref:hybrid sensor histidine kinase/response regulator transcription factor n=1 Tax=Arenibacter sp. 6A1 TaxID=2720391 RepID=UPI001445E3C0|nr:hybrid sensor histidine kinase/response regulator transcription factor [Arenibacter sp. 6A1]NKI27525.1 response regulator [Arenibacter sp. 6A1]
MKSKLFHFFCLLFLSYGLLGQSNRFINLDREDGLVSNFVRAIFQDAYGYMWFGTDNGLNRYDGIQMETYQHVPEDERSLSNNHIQDIFQTSSNKLLICTSTGIDVYNYKTQEFRRVRFIGNYRLKGFRETFDNKVWVLTNNKVIIVLDADLQFLYTIDFAQIGNEENIRLNNLWMFDYDQDNLALYDEKSGFFLFNVKTKRLKLLSKHILPVSTRVFGIHPVNEQEFWVATLKGVFAFQNGNLYKRFTKEPHNNTPQLTSNFVLDIRQMPNNEIWLFTDGGGINIYNKITNRFKYLKNNIDDDYSLGSNFIFTTHIDNNSTLWIGTIKNGVSQLDANNPFITHNLLVNEDYQRHNVPVSSLFLDSKNRIWVGSDGNGLYKLVDNHMEHVVLDSKIKTISAINEVNSEQLILGTYKNGVATLDLNKNKSTIQKNIIKSINQDVKITFLEKDSYGRFWLGSNNIVTTIPNEGESLYQVNTDRAPINLRALSYAQHNKDTLLFGGVLGIYQYDQNGFKMISNVPEDINYILKLDRNNYWLATRKGLCLFNVKNTEASFYGLQNGLNSQEVNVLISDNSNNIWVGTDQGISKFDIDTKSFTNYTYKDGFTDNSFQINSVLKDKYGKLFFGGTKGVLTFHPDSIISETKIKKVIITKILVNYEDVSSDKQMVLEKPIEETQLITLSHNQKVLTVNFSSFDFKQPEKIDFSYKLEGYDDEWRFTSNRGITYMNLEPGEYTLKLKASDTAKNWNDTYTGLDIKVLPAWWQTLWFKLGVFIFLVLIIYSINYFILKKAESKRALEFEKKSLKEQNEIHEKQIKFFTNISHEIRTPLSLILSPLEAIVKEGGLSSKVVENLFIVQKNALRIKKLIDRGIDFRKAKFKEPEMQPGKQDIVAFLRELSESFNSFSKSKNITLIFKSDVDSLFMWFDEYMTETIFYNLLSNAFKFSGPNENIIMSVFSEKDKVRITVQDFGSGIPSDDLVHIFQRYYQAKSHLGGSGIGLALTKKFVEAHEGEIGVKSEIGIGSCFEVVFPLINQPSKVNNLFYYNSKEKVVPVEEFPHSKEKETINLKVHTVLIVENEKSLRDYLRVNLAPFHKIIIAAHGKEAWHIVNNRKIDLVVSDVMMPEMDGLALCELIKGNSKTSNLPIILLTAKTLTEDKIKGFETGADAYLEKPFQLEVLRSRIDNLLVGKERQSKKMLEDLKIPLDAETISTSDEEFLKKCLSIIEVNIDNPDFNIPIFSRELGMSKSLIYKRMGGITNMTINELILSVRLQKASYMLTHTKKSIVDISLLVGFKNPKYFSTCFKRKFGLTPSNYRSEQLYKD